jgi:hypothetical protein
MFLACPHRLTALLLQHALHSLLDLLDKLHLVHALADRLLSHLQLRENN